MGMLLLHVLPNVFALVLFVGVLVILLGHVA